MHFQLFSLGDKASSRVVGEQPVRLELLGQCDGFCLALIQETCLLPCECLGAAGRCQCPNHKPFRPICPPRVIELSHLSIDGFWCVDRSCQGQYVHDLGFPEVEQWTGVADDDSHAFFARC